MLLQQQGAVMMVPVPVRCRIPEHLRKIGKTQQWLADQTGLGKQRISDYCHLRYVMNIPTGYMISELLNVYIDDIYEWEWREQE